MSAGMTAQLVADALLMAVWRRGYGAKQRDAKSENVFAFSGRSWSSSVSSCHHIEKIDIFIDVAYECCSANRRGVRCGRFE
jgi:hypothetical protein